MPKASAILRIGFRSQRQMLAVADALKPETMHLAGSRAWTTVVARGRELVLRFEGRDSASLRAVVTSYLRLIRASVNSSNALLELDRGTPRSVRDKK
jgi:tRNA threonylcarbamoyladenosine modification (KEOPS) complex  Pcc1 subunit